VSPLWALELRQHPWASLLPSEVSGLMDELGTEETVDHWPFHDRLYVVFVHL
jgi:hypothetical protein